MSKVTAAAAAAKLRAQYRSVIVGKKDESETGNSVSSGQRYPSLKKIIASTKRSISTKAGIIVNKYKQSNIILSDERRE